MIIVVKEEGGVTTCSSVFTWVAQLLLMPVCCQKQRYLSDAGTGQITIDWMAHLALSPDLV